MNLVTRISSIVAGLALCVSATAFAQDQGSDVQQQGQSQQATQSERSEMPRHPRQNHAAMKKDRAMLPPGEASSEFVRLAAQNSLAEIELGKLAMQKSKDPAVQKFAQQMMQDHTQANAELAPIAKKHDLTVPTTLDPKHRKKMEELQSLSGEEFDAAYARHMTDSHQKAVSLFREASQGDKVNPDLTAFASETLPKLQQHEKMAQRLESMQQRSASAAGASESGARSGQSEPEDTGMPAESPGGSEQTTPRTESEQSSRSGQSSGQSSGEYGGQSGSTGARDQ